MTTISFDIIVMYNNEKGIRYKEHSPDQGQSI
jgi:hypothetical protein